MSRVVDVNTTGRGAVVVTIDVGGDEHEALRWSVPPSWVPRLERAVDVDSPEFAAWVDVCVSEGEAIADQAYQQAESLGLVAADENGAQA